MDDYGNIYSMHMSALSCYQWYISMSAYGGVEDWDGYAVHTV